MRQWFYAILISGLGLLVMSRPNRAHADADDAKLQGVWRVVSVFRDGRLSLHSEGYLKVLIYDNKIVFTGLGDQQTENSFTYRIDASTIPRTLNTEWDIRPFGNAVVTPGIYEIEKGRLRICQGATRPTGFETSPDDRRTLFVLEPDTPAGPTPSVSAVAESRAAIFRKITANLPNGWICERGLTSVTLRRKEEPVIVNLMQRPNYDRPNEGETEEDWARRHAVDAKYRIVLRLTPKVDPSVIQKMVEDNHKIRLEIEKDKGPSFFQHELPDWTDAETIRLLQSLHVLPDGYWGDLSVYVMPTNLGYASFLKEEDRAECERVTKRVVSLLNSYAAGSRKSAGKE